MQRRECLRAGAIAMAALLTGCAQPPPQRAVARCDARVSRSGRMRADRVPVYTKIASALRAAPESGGAPFRIEIDEGEWREKLVIDKPDIHLIGAGRDRTRIRFDAAAGHLTPGGTPWGTWGCATVIVRAPGFRAEQLGIENGFDYIEHLRNPQLQQIGSNGAQAVALMLDRGADRSVLSGIDLVSHQDTLFADGGRSLFHDCRISGSVDFVFGAGNALLQHCTLHSRFRPGKDRQGYIAAPSTRADQAFGLSFVDCTLTRDAEIPDGSVALGRAWRPTRTFADGDYGDLDVLGAAAFIRCRMDAHIAAAGWDEMAYTARDGSRVMLAPGDARFAEYASEGAGAARNSMRRQLDHGEAARYTSAGMFDDWRPAA